MSVSEIERSIIKKYRKEIWRPFIKAIKRYALVEEGDRIAVCISGGKDSFLLAKCMQELERHGEFHFGLQFIVMDPGYTQKNRDLIEQNAKKMDIPVQIFPSDIFEVVSTVGEGSPCYLCARMRRGYLYEFAKKVGCNKIALGHHFNDVVETTLLSMFYGAEVKTMMPKLLSTSHEGMELIRPLYGVEEEAIKAWARYNGLTFLNCACRFTERVANKEEESKRREIKQMIAEWKKVNPELDKNVFRSLHNVNLEGTIGWRKNGLLTDFLAEYQKNKKNILSAVEKEENLLYNRERTKGAETPSEGSMNVAQLEAFLQYDKSKEEARVGYDMCGKYARCRYCVRNDQFPCANAHNALVAAQKTAEADNIPEWFVGEPPVEAIFGVTACEQPKEKPVEVVPQCECVQEVAPVEAEASAEQEPVEVAPVEQAPVEEEQPAPYAPPEDGKYRLAKIGPPKKAEPDPLPVKEEEKKIRLIAFQRK